MVVGHTHNRLDQWFSVLSKAIQNRAFIGSVIALHALYKIAHSDEESNKRPSRVIQLDYYHDWVEYLEPHINDKIKNYQIPHRTKFSLHDGKCIMQYMVFSPSVDWKENWLPHIPSYEVIDSVSKTNFTIPLSQYVLFNGVDTVYKELGLEADSDLHSILDHNKQRETLQAVANCIPTIKVMEKKAIHDMMIDSEKTCCDGIPYDRIPGDEKLFANIESAMLSMNNKKEGFIMWLKRDTDAYFLNARPTVLPNPRYWTSIISPPAVVSADSNSAQGITVNEPLIKDIDEEDEIDEGETKPEAHRVSFDRSVNSRVDVPMKKRSSKQSRASLQLMAFKRGASDMVATADIVMSYPAEKIAYDPNPYISIEDATSNFQQAVLTQQEKEWYKSISKMENIMDSVQKRADSVSLNPWHLLDLPQETEDQKRKHAEIAATMALKRQLAIARLEPHLTRRGQGIDIYNLYSNFLSTLY